MKFGNVNFYLSWVMSLYNNNCKMCNWYCMSYRPILFGFLKSLPGLMLKVSHILLIVECTIVTYSCLNSHPLVSGPFISLESYKLIKFDFEGILLAGQGHRNLKKIKISTGIYYQLQNHWFPNNWLGFKHSINKNYSLLQYFF